MAKSQFSFESNVVKVTEKIHESPFKVLNIIGQNLVREIKATTLRGAYNKRTGRLDKSLQYWARKEERDLQIGFKEFYGRYVMGPDNDPIKPVVVKNAELIKQMIAEAIDEINKE